MMGRVWNSPFCAKSDWEGFAGAKSGVSLSPITSALLGVISVYPPVTQCSGAEQDFILWLCHLDPSLPGHCTWQRWDLSILSPHIATLHSQPPGKLSSGEKHFIPTTCSSISPLWDEHWLEWGETEADVEPHVPGFGSWHFLPHFNTEIWG